MKAALFNQQIEDKAKNIEKKTGEKRFEWFMFRAVLTTLIILIAAQTALLNPSVRSNISDYYIEGDPLMSEAYLFVPCKMELKLIDLDKCEDLKVHVNGSERAAFDSNAILLELKDSDVVELAAGSAPVLAKVQVTAVSENINGILGKIITPDEGITLVAKIKTSH